MTDSRTIDWWVAIERRRVSNARRTAGALVLGALAFGFGGCGMPGDACGNGVVNAGEACDDGNTVGGDGCSATCQLDDDASTPGDDRAGYVACGNAAPGEPSVCGPDQGCCYDSQQPLMCTDTRADCPDQILFVACDGPEDCATGEQCFEHHAVYCGKDDDFGVRCHTDADCLDPDINPCVNGSCAGKPRRPACGNGIVEDGETCDDGNTVDGDGCSSTCIPDDNLATPGDDRAGYVACSSVDAGSTLVCGPDEGCCWDGTSPTTCTTFSECSLQIGFGECDGPEDCPEGVQCRLHHGSFCGSGGFTSLCHTDADCAPLSPAHCDRGACVPGAPLTATTPTAE